MDCESANSTTLGVSLGALGAFAAMDRWEIAPTLKISGSAITAEGVIDYVDNVNHINQHMSQWKREITALSWCYLCSVILHKTTVGVE